MAEEKKNINNMEEKKLKHLEFIQGVITRMNSNSFSIKTWMITIIAAFWRCMQMEETLLIS